MSLLQSGKPQSHDIAVGLQAGKGDSEETQAPAPEEGCGQGC